MMIRTNIKQLKPFSKDIAKCKSFDDYAKIFWKAKELEVSNDLKGSVGENFFDELNKKYPNITGFTTTEFRPATKDEDYYEAVDTIGKTLKDIDGKQQDALVQVKAYNPFNPGARLTWDDISRVLKKVKDHSINGDYVLICTFLHEKQLSQEVASYFEWRVCRNHFENALKGNNEFFRNFAKRIDQEYDILTKQFSGIVSAEKSKLSKIKRKKYQTQSLKHAVNNPISFIKLPPGSGKTRIQADLAEDWLNHDEYLVYISPQLDLLDQNMYKILLHLKATGYDNFDVNMICSRKSFSFNQGNTSFIDDEDVICDTNLNQGKDQERSLNGNRKNVIGVTVASYPKLEKFCIEHGIKINRIVDEALENIPETEKQQSIEDEDKQRNKWDTFSNMSIVERSASFDAFEKESKSASGSGTNNINVFGKKFSKSFEDMINEGVIVDLQLRVIYYNAKDFNNDDEINLHLLCRALDDMIDDKDVSSNKMIGFCHNAQICDEYLPSLKDYVEDRIEYVNSVIAETKDRPAILQKYKDSLTGILLNFGCLGKGIDDSTTSATFIGRNMASIYGLHGIHRSCRSHEKEWGLPPEKHIIKSVGLAYIGVAVDDNNSIVEYDDLKSMLTDLYSIGWKDNVRVVKSPRPNTTKDEDDGTNKPDPIVDPIDTDNNIDDKLIRVMNIVHENIIDRDAKIAYNDIVDRINTIHTDDDYFNNLLKQTA